MNEPKPLSPARATEVIRRIARGDFELDETKHSKQQMALRGLWMPDLLEVQSHGFVHLPGEPATRLGYFKYKMESGTPNTNNRTVRVVVIPDEKRNALKIVTVMWADESLVGG